eukprot:TRINITY_DN112820_c0_g1_i1.p1 TRINITY_DN112820_c0_g1~~TRINITY_DN112820_c0_g1_i1.p1  ORF type:complete len:304 (+),score=67.10 TRINITY_DN112820_c0_g1_i1:150-1061(+)
MAHGAPPPAMPPGQAPPVIEQRKAEGGDLFRQGSYEEALKCYEEALQMLDEVDASNVTAPFPALRCTLCANEALCLLKLERYVDAEVRASAALALDAAHSKASYRRGLARLQLKDAAGALEDLQRAARLEPQNKEVRLKLEEAQRLSEEEPINREELSTAEKAVTVLGSEDGGLYGEKPDLNEGRLAETRKEQRDWISTISSWAEIQDISFADEESKISVYMALPGIQNIPPNKVCVWMQPNSLEVRVVDLEDKNYCYVASELWGQIDAEASSYKIRRDKLSLKLIKRASARSWDRWEKLRRG